MNDSPAGHRPVEDDELLRALTGGTAGETGEGFFRALVPNVARALDGSGARITELGGEGDRLRESQ